MATETEKSDLSPFASPLLRHIEKHIAITSFCDPVFRLLSSVSGQEACGNSIFRSCLQKAPASPESPRDSTFQLQEKRTLQVDRTRPVNANPFKKKHED